MCGAGAPLAPGLPLSFRRAARRLAS
jgi:hypothetical protein